jgi:hypothetical protein
MFLVDGDDRVWLWDHEQEGSPDAVLPMNQHLDQFLAALAR